MHVVDVCRFSFRDVYFLFHLRKKTKLILSFSQFALLFFCYSIVQQCLQQQQQQQRLQKHRMGVIGRYHFEIAEQYHNSLQENGLTVDMIQVDDE